MVASKEQTTEERTIMDKNLKSVLKTMASEKNLPFVDYLAMSFPAEKHSPQFFSIHYHHHNRHDFFSTQHK